MAARPTLNHGLAEELIRFNSDIAVAGMSITTFVENLPVSQREYWEPSGNMLARLLIGVRGVLSRYVLSMKGGDAASAFEFDETETELFLSALMHDCLKFLERFREMVSFDPKTITPDSAPYFEETIDQVHQATVRLTNFVIAQGWKVRRYRA